MKLRSLSAAVLGLFAAPLFAADGPKLELKPGDKVVLIGNLLAERESYFGHIETRLHARFPKHKLVVRNLGWSGDTVDGRSDQFAFGVLRALLKPGQPPRIGAKADLAPSLAAAHHTVQPRQFQQPLRAQVGLAVKVGEVRGVHRHHHHAPKAAALAHDAQRHRYAPLP